MTQNAANMIAIEACVFDYNARVTAQMGGINSTQTATMLIPTAGNQCPMSISGHTGTKFSFSPGTACGTGGGNVTVADLDICGWYFVPNAAATGVTDPTAQAAYTAEAAALTAAIPALTTAATTGANGINTIMDPTVGGTAQTTAITLDASTQDAVVAYQVAQSNAMAALAANQATTVAQAVATLEPYGWVFAGALLNMVSRIQAMLSNAVTAGMPEVHPPVVTDPNTGMGNNPASPNAAAENNPDIRVAVAHDLQNYNVLLSSSWAQKQATNAQCAAMIGLQDASNGSGINGAVNNVVDALLVIVDRVAAMFGVWTASPTTAQTCGGGANAPAIFQIGIQQIGTTGDPLYEMAALGHANIDTAFTLLGISMVGQAVAPGIGQTLTGLLGSKAGPFAPLVGAAFGGAAGVAGVLAGAMGFLALIFMVCGFTLAYILPMFPFTRFFFQVLVWVAAVLEAVIAVPMIALAHLNPEGEGLPGQSAKGAYFYVFNILLRPILMIFGLICGLLLFLIGVSFLNYAFNLAVASAGGTAFGHEIISKIFYTIMYVTMMYICANHSFALIDHIPEKAMSWLGAQAQSMANIGNASHMAGMEQAVGSYATQQMMGGMGSGAGQVGQALGNGVQSGFTTQQAAAAQRAATSANIATSLTPAQETAATNAAKPIAAQIENALEGNNRPG